MALTFEVLQQDKLVTLSQGMAEDMKDLLIEMNDLGMMSGMTEESWTAEIGETGKSMRDLFRDLYYAQMTRLMTYIEENISD